MNAKTFARFEAQAKVIKAMAHPTRLFIVDELSRREKCVCEIRDLVGADISTVSKHLSILKNAGIIEDERRGSQIYYSLKMPCVMNFFKCVCTVISHNAKEQLTLTR